MNFKQYLRPGKEASDITPLLQDKEAFHQLIDELTNLAKELSMDKVACIEGRGFLLGSAVAYKLNVGLVPIRIEGKLKNETYSQTYTDYSNKEKTLEMHTDAITKGENILIVDDWLETGSTIKTAIALIEKCGGTIVGII